MELKDFVLENQKVIDLVKDRTGGNTQVDMYYGTLDYATTRFHTILIKISQDRILEEIHSKDVKECFDTIQDFYNNVQRYRFWPGFMKPFIKAKLHWIGKKRIPAIKKLLNRLENNIKFYHHGDDTV
jgi:hypothetical protein|tara:strand:+ start:382 stop:762 length:381 start_codon:yes stop_codon:yes gene_type:complete